MPIREYSCKHGHTVSIVCKANSSIEGVNKIMCPSLNNITIGLDELTDNIESWYGKCGEIAEKIWSLPAKSAPKDDGKGLVYFENKKGHVEFSSIADKDRWQPEGYVKKEARNLHERDVLERRLRRQDDSRLAEQFEKRDMQRHFSEKVRHSDLRNAIQQGEIVLPDKDSQGNRITVKLDDRTKGLLKRGMERTVKKTRQKPNSELRLSVNHESAGTIRNKK